MLLFGHTGITVGIVRACDILMARVSTNIESSPGSRISVTVQRKSIPLRCSLARIKNRLGSIDYRWVLLGSLLPDIIDKPIWLFISGGLWPAGRAWGHTLLFNLLLFVFGLILFKYRKPCLLVISLSSFIHLVLDQMWKNMITLFWPLFGQFRSVGTTGWMSDITHSLFLEPATYIPEIIGLAVILFLGYRLLVNEGITDFIKRGHL